MHNRQSGPSRTGVAANAQLLIIVLLNTQFSQPGTDCSAGAIIMEENKARRRHVFRGEKGNKYGEWRGTRARSRARTLIDKAGRRRESKQLKQTSGLYSRGV